MSDTARALNALQALDAGCGRPEWVRIGMAAKDAGLSLDDFTEWSSNAQNYEGERDCKQAWHSFTDGPVKAATLFSMAFAAGWNDTAKPRHNGHSKRPAFTRTADPRHARKPPQQAVRSVADLWNHCAPADDTHPYIIAKNGRPDGLRVVPSDDNQTIAGQSVAGWLVVPARSLNGDLRTLQFIPPPGIEKKLNLPGASFGDGLFTAGDLSQSARAYIVEGIGQAWACWIATGYPAIVCFGAGRMATVAQLLRQRLPDLSLVVVPDRGKESQAAEIARAVRGQWIELPDDKPANYDANDYAAEHGAGKLAALLNKAKASPMRYRVLAAGDLLNAPPLQWLVRGVLPAQGLACMYGASGSGKSFLALDMGAAVAEGAEWFDYRVTAAAVVYVALEGEHGFRQRVKAWQAHQRRDLPAALRFVMQPFDLRNADDLAQLAEAVTASGCAGGLLVIDTLNRAASGADENTSKDMGEIIDASKRLQSQLGGTVLLIHHSGKDQTKGLRGHSSLHAALDAAIEVTRINDRREWNIAKSKDDGDSAAFPFRLEVVDIGEDEEGDRIASCAIVPGDRTDAIKRVKLPSGPTQKIAHDTLGELLRSATTCGKAGAPPLRPCVELEAAVLTVADRLPCRPDARNYQARRAITSMSAKGMYQVREGWIWDAQ